jgi:hypothetical protein
MSLKKLLTVVVVSLALHISAHADTIALHPDAPERYVVVKGDTLWDISARFLRDPWLWPEIWQVNPEITNPHLIYPGDVILLTYDESGRPRLTLQRGRPTVKLSPQARSTEIQQAIPTIPLEAIRQFLSHAQVMDKEDYDQAPHIVSFDASRIIAGSNDVAYATGNLAPDIDIYNVVRLGNAYINPGDGEILGYEAMEVATAQRTRKGDPATFYLTQSRREVLLGDRLFPVTDQENLQSYTPRAVGPEHRGNIIAVLDGVSRIGQFQVVAINLGSNDGIKPGHVFGVFQSGRTVRDAFAEGGPKMVTLPDERAGIMMVFRPFERVSYGLIMRAEKDMRVGDAVRSPNEEQ